jgi:hypothetical protein
MVSELLRLPPFSRPLSYYWTKVQYTDSFAFDRKIPRSNRRKSVTANLTLIAGGNFDWPTLIANNKEVAMNYEQVEDSAT